MQTVQSTDFYRRSIRPSRIARWPSPGRVRDRIWASKLPAIVRPAKALHASQWRPVPIWRAVGAILFPSERLSLPGKRSNENAYVHLVVEHVRCVKSSQDQTNQPSAPRAFYLAIAVGRLPALLHAITLPIQSYPMARLSARSRAT